MIEPHNIIKLKDRTSSGALRTRDVLRISHQLYGGSFVILPSDTCYSLAALANSTERFKTINIILNRKDEPISIAFPNVLAAQSYADLDFYTNILLERFTPGPITIVCNVISEGSVFRNITEIVQTIDGTVGIRIPDSNIEREVAGFNPPYPITTVAIRDHNKRIVQNLDTAIDIVINGLKKLKTLQRGFGQVVKKELPGEPSLIAIEGDKFFDTHSTVVKVERRELRLLREGAIDYKDIVKACHL